MKVYLKVSNSWSEEPADINVISTKLKTPKMDNQVTQWDGQRTGSGLIKLTYYSTDHRETGGRVASTRPWKPDSRSECFVTFSIFRVLN